MIDEEILEELLVQKKVLEERIKECEQKKADYVECLARTNRLIELLQGKRDDSKRTD